MLYARLAAVGKNQNIIKIVKKKSFNLNHIFLLNYSSNDSSIVIKKILTKKRILFLNITNK